VLLLASMVPEHSTRLALDTNVLLDLAKGASDVIRFFEASRKKGYALAAPATVLAELDAASRDASDPERQKLADIAQDTMMVAWDVVPMPEPLRPEDTENFSLMLRTRKLLPMSERNDGLIVAECSLEGIGLLITSDAALLSPRMDSEELALAFSDARLPTQVAIMHHTRITYILRRLPDRKA
jgi:predicted nucleic acid-binding protein